MFDKLLSRCPYCNDWLTADNCSREHLVPRSKGGRGMILVCMDCNRTRGNSLDDRRFVNFVLHDPDLYRRHVKMASCDDGTKTELLEVLPNTLSSAVRLGSRKSILATIFLIFAEYKLFP